MLILVALDRVRCEPKQLKKETGMIRCVSRTANLTLRQDIADHVERGETQAQIAKDLGITRRAVIYPTVAEN